MNIIGAYQKLLSGQKICRMVWPSGAHVIPGKIMHGAESCSVCRFGNPVSCVCFEPKHEYGTKYECRKRAPDPGFPIMEPTDWCGNFEHREK